MVVTALQGKIAIRFPEPVEQLCLMEAAPGGEGESSNAVETLYGW